MIKSPLQNCDGLFCGFYVAHPAVWKEKGYGYKMQVTVVLPIRSGMIDACLVTRFGCASLNQHKLI